MSEDSIYIKYLVHTLSLVITLLRGKNDAESIKVGQLFLFVF